MVPGHSSFSVEIKKLKFITEEGKRFPCTALIKFHLEGKDKPLVELMGYMGEKEIYKAIDEGEALNLDYCYIDKFSLKDYRLLRNLDSREVVKINGFTAKNSLFGGYTTLDFSFALFEGNEFSMENAWITRGDIIFESSKFKNRTGQFSQYPIP